MGTATELQTRMSLEKGSLSIEDADNMKLDSLNALKPIKHFIIQKKTSTDYFTRSNVTHEILDTRKNVLLRASRPKSMFFKKTKEKIIARNLRNAEIFRIVIEPTNNLQVTNSEASIYIYPKTKIAHVETYGGVYSQRSCEIFNKEGQPAFTIDPVVKKTGNTSSMLEYSVSTKTGTFANIMMKTGLNCILSTDACCNVLEKSALIAVILAMDILKSGSREKEPAKNLYD